MALTAVLLELELEKEVVIGQEDEDEVSGEPTLYNALVRLQDELEECSDSVYGDIIEACLHLYEISGDLGKESRNEKIKAELFREVVNPLKRRYEVFTGSAGNLKAIELASYVQRSGPEPMDATYLPMEGIIEEPEDMKLAIRSRAFTRKSELQFLTYAEKVRYRLYVSIAYLNVSPDFEQRSVAG